MRQKAALITVVLIITGALPVSAARGLPAAHLVLWMQETALTIQRLGIQQIFDEWAAHNAPGATLRVIPKEADELVSDFTSTDAGIVLPDLLWTVADNVAPFAAAKRIAPLTVSADFVPALAALGLAGGSLYAVPIQAGNHMLLFYNKRFVKEPPRTFDALRALSKRASTPPSDFSAVVFSQADGFFVFPFAHGFGATEFAADGKTPALNSKAWLTTYQFLHTLVFDDAFEPNRCDYFCADARFSAGKAAMILSVDGAMFGENGYLKRWGDDLGVAPLPSLGADVAQNVPAPFVDGVFVMLTRPADSGEKLQTATAFTTFLATDKATALRWTIPNGRLPALLSALRDVQSGNPLLADSIQVMLTAKARPVNREWPCVLAAVNYILPYVMTDSITAEQAAQKSQDMAVACLAHLT